MGTGKSMGALTALLLAFAGAAQANIAVNKSFNPISVPTGQVSTLTVTLLNSGSSAASGVSVTDALPSGLLIANPSNATTTCGGTVSATSGGGSVSLAGGIIPAATTGPGSCTITVDVIGAAGGSFINVIPPGGVVSSEGSNAQGAQATLTVVPLAPVAASKAFSSAYVHGNGPITLTITLPNTNSVPLTGVGFTDTLPSQLAIASPSNATTTCGAGTVVATPGSHAVSLGGGVIPANGSCVVSVSVVPSNPNAPLSAVVTNTVPANAVATDQGATNTAPFSATTRVMTGAVIAKSFSPNPIQSGATGAFTITITNYNLTPLTPVTFIDPMPAGIAPTNVATTCGGTTGFTATTVTLTGGTVPASPEGNTSSTCTVTVTYTALNTTTSPVTRTNTIPAGNFGGVNYNAGSGSVVINPPGDISATKAFTGTATQTGIVTLTIRLNNASATPAAITSFTDNLTSMGAGFTVAATPAAATTCGGTVNAAVGGTSITKNDGAIPANGFCTITVPVQIAGNATVATHTNTIAAGAIKTSRGDNTGSVSAPLTVAAALTAAKAFSPTTIASGSQASVLTITLTRRAGAAALTNLAFTDNLPTAPWAMRVASPPNATTTCAGGTVTAAPGAATVSLSGATLAVGNGGAATSCTVKVSVVASMGAEGIDTNTLGVGAVTSTDQNVANAAAASATLTARNAAISLAKGFAPAAVALGGSSTMSVQILNNNPGAINLTGVALTDVLPVGMQVATPNGASFTGAGCSGGTITAVPGSGSASLASATVSAGSLCVLKVNVVAVAAGNLINNLPAGSATSTQGPTNLNPVSATLTAGGRADLQVTKTDGVATVIAGGTTSYTIVVRNAGPDAVAGAEFTDTPPAGMSFVSWSCAASPGGSCPAASGAGPIVGNVAIPKDGTVTFTVVASVAPGATGSLSNTASVIPPGSVVDPDSSNNSSTDTDTVTVQSGLQVTKDDGATTYTPGGTATYDVTVTNAGPSNASAVTVTDTLPSGVTLAGTPTCTVNGVASCGTLTGTVGGSSFGASGASVAAGAGNGLVFHLPVRYDAGLTGAVTNTVSVSDPSDPAGPHSASDTDTRVGQAALAVVKTDGSGFYTPGGTATYTVTVTNTGLTNAANVTVGDSLPAGVTLSAVVTCTASGVATCGTVSGAVGGNVFAATGASIGAGAGNALTFTLPVAFAAAMSVDPLVNIATASDPDDPNGPASGSDSDVRTPTSGLSIAKDDGSTTYTPGGTATYTITVMNTGPSNADDVTVSDTLPAGVTLAAVPTCTVIGTATCGTLAGAVGGGSFGATAATLNAGAGNSLIYTLHVQFASDLVADPLVNTASVSDPSDPNPHTASDSDTLAPVTGLAISKTDGSASYTPGTTATYTITVTNAGPSDASGVGVTDTLPAGVTLTAAPTCASTGTAGCGTLTGSAGDDSFTSTGGTLAAGAGNALVFTVPVAFAADLSTNPLINTASASDATQAPPVSASDSDSLSATTGLAITKDDGSTSYTPGGTATYTIVLTNEGPSNASNVTISDPLPAGVTLTGTPTCTVTGTASCGTITGASGDAAFGATGVAVTAGSGNSVTYEVPVQFAPQMEANPLANTVTATVPGSGQTATATDSDTRATQTSLVILKSDGRATYTPGGTATYTITLANAGPSHATGVAVTDTLPTGVTLTAAPTCVAAGNAVCGTLTGAPGDSAFTVAGASLGTESADKLTYSLPVAFAPDLAVTPLVNTATARDGSGGTPVSASDSDTLEPVSDLSITKNDGVASVTPGGSVTYTIVASNAGPGDVMGATVTDTFPASITSATWTCAGTNDGTCTASGSGNIDDTVDLPVGASVTYTVTAVISASATDTVVNTATVTVPIGTTDPDSSNNSSTDTDTVTVQSGLQVTKDDGSTTYTPGGTATYDVTVTNAGPSNASAVTVTDTLPSGVTLAGTPTCTVNGVASCGTLTGTVGGSSFGASGASVAAGVGNGLVFHLPVRYEAGLTGPVTNTVSVSDPSDPAGPHSASDTDTRVGQAALAVVKTDGSGFYTPGGTATYTVTVTNAGLTNATNVTVGDSLPAGVTLSAAVTCTASGAATCGTVSGAVGGNVFAATGASIGAGAGNALTFTVPVAFAAAMSVDPLVNIATASDPDDPNGPASGSDSDVRTPTSGLSIAKDDGSTTYTPGGTATYTITVMNAGPSQATGIVVDDILPAGVTLTAAPTCVSAGSASCGTLTGAAGGSVFSATGASLGAASADRLTYTLPVAFASDLTVTPLVNTVTARDGSGSPPVSASDSNALGARPDLAIVKSHSGDFRQGQVGALYTLVVSNVGGAASSGIVTVAEAAPTGLTVTAMSGAGWNCAPAIWACTRSDPLPAGGSYPPIAVTVDVAADAPENLTNVASVANPDDPNHQNDQSFDPTVIGPAAPGSADLAIRKVGPAEIQAGGVIAYTITVTNLGPDAAVNAVVNDPTPTGLAFVSAGAPCAGGFPCDLGTLASGQSVVIGEVRFQVPASLEGERIVNTASVTTTSTDPTPDNNSSTVGTLVTGGGSNPEPAPVPLDPRWMLLGALALLIAAGSRMRARR